MKKLGFLTAIMAFGLVMTFTECRKKRTDPCELKECADNEKCVDGKCVKIRKP
jgi:hypothetical protein